MISEELKSIVNRLNEKGKMKFLEGVSKEKILAFESEVGCELPTKYKEWLQYSDGGECFLPAGVQLYGIEHKPMIDVNDNNRPDDTFIVIGVLSTGDPILCKKNGNQVAIYNQEAGRVEDDEIYHDFFAFLNDLSDLLGIGG